MCVAKFDHHSPLINNCVGCDNHRPYVFMLVLMLFLHIAFIYMLNNCTHFFKNIYSLQLLTRTHRLENNFTHHSESVFICRAKFCYTFQCCTRGCISCLLAQHSTCMAIVYAVHTNQEYCSRNYIQRINQLQQI